jgi:MFS family permease
VAVLLLAVGVATLGSPHPVVAPRARRGRRFVASRVLLVLGVVCALGFMIENGLESWSAVQLADTLGAGPGVAGLGPAAFSAAMVVGRLAMHRLDNPRLLSGAALLCAAGLALFAATDSVALALTGVVIAGLGVSGVAPTILGMGGRVAAEGEQSASIATVTTVSYLGFLVGPVLVGGIAGATSLRVGLAALAVIGLVLSAALFRVAQRT